MYALVNNSGELGVYTEKTDVCKKCKNAEKCPLILAICNEYVVMRYSSIEVKHCGLFKNK